MEGKKVYTRSGLTNVMLASERRMSKYSKTIDTYLRENAKITKLRVNQKINTKEFHRRKDELEYNLNIEKRRYLVASNSWKWAADLLREMGDQNILEISV